ncbi:MAG TPA: bifunctional UDP-N-acetylmuramoyl-tripeptide:D-alanyl-D-alanine ligase/alanine racemase [Chitinophagaceae bacterium]|nr:bifunctional UDP-N-acetylmuramoyl-tripeptide:D-alanyl-D-alanine ligase/alanine racemase [Chitinophagaceae bacterium]
MVYSIKNIFNIIGAEGTLTNDHEIENILIDSRKVHTPSSSLFFALKGPRRDGHQFIPELYKKGVRNFVVSETADDTLFPDSNFLLVDDTQVALQQLAAQHRSQFDYPVIGITGSNGKTIVKEWLYQLLHSDYSIVRSPKSYNSQVGVPLSVWQMDKQHNLALFEAGISQQGEMLRLERIIRPTIGILTNIGEAHSEGFVDPHHKFREKLVLFRNSKVLIARDIDMEDQKEFLSLLSDELSVLTWGYAEKNDFLIRNTSSEAGLTTFILDHKGKELAVSIPFTDDASIENAITCSCLLLQLGLAPEQIAARMKLLQPVNMRLEMKNGINDCLLINDSYSADLSSLQIALNFLEQQQTKLKKTVIISDFLQSAIPDEELYPGILENMRKHQVSRVIGIGERIAASLLHESMKADKDMRIELYPETSAFLKEFKSSAFRDEAILVKGARVFTFEKIVRLLEEKAHQTVLEINLNAIAHNLKEYQGKCKPDTRIMAMVKAFAYGSGGAEIAAILQFHKVDWLAVAYADEGVELRKAGITLPIMVMNPDEHAFESLVEYDLEPELFSFSILQSFDQFLKKEGIENFPVHIELETGMNRLGFAAHEMEKLATTIRDTISFKVRTVFSHLAASEDPKEDAFTMQQASVFNQAVQKLRSGLGYDFLVHIANSAAVIRHPALHMNMVRLGIGLYGVDSSGSKTLNLLPVATLRSTVAQLKQVKAGESVSYNRKGIVQRDSLIATIRLGYADGYPRKLSNGKGKMIIHGKEAPVIGTICMDMTMLDVTDIHSVKEGDEVIVFGSPLPVHQLAAWAETIPYEIMTGISQRVKRIYFEE